MAASQLEPAQEAKLRSAFQLLEDNLRPEERDRESPSYCLGWYERLEADQFRKEDLEHFRRFVDEMAERALRRVYRTGALFDDALLALDATLLILSSRRSP